MLIQKLNTCALSVSRSLSEGQLESLYLLPETTYLIQAFFSRSFPLVAVLSTANNFKCRDMNLEDHTHGHRWMAIAGWLAYMYMGRGRWLPPWLWLN